MWDPDQYRRFAAERARPFAELVARIGAVAPRSVVDLGCGPGDLTVDLSRRWPGAALHGVDSSPEMIEAARKWEGQPGLSFELADLRDWRRPLRSTSWSPTPCCNGYRATSDCSRAGCRGCPAMGG